MAKLPCLLVLLAANLAAQIVEGNVFDASTGAGVAGVKVDLTKGATGFYETITDGGGHFRFDNVKEGDYAIRYQSPDHWQTAGISDYREFRVAGGSPVKLETRLMPWSRITGRIVDGRGNPVPNAQLDLTGQGVLINGRTYLRTSWGGGGGGQLSNSPLRMTFRGKTGAQGEFQVQVMPGAYGLSVTPPDWKAPEHEPDGPEMAWKRTYYPGVTRPESAARIMVLPGGGNPDVELKLQAVPAHAVRGVVLNPDGTPASKVTVTLGGSNRVTSVLSAADGAFEFPAVAEGEWLFGAELQTGAVKLRAGEWIEVSRHDLENVKLRLVRPITIRGKVVLEGSKDAPLPKPGPIILSGRGPRAPEEGDPLPRGIAAVGMPDAKGDFAVEEAYPGVFTLGPQLQPPSPPYYLDAVRVGGADLMTGELQIESSVMITVVYRADGGVVRGKAENCSSGGVLLVPRDSSQRGRGFSRSGPCDANDNYEVRGLRPGEYNALAFAGNGLVPAVDEALLSQAVKVTVRAGEATFADLRTATRPVY